ncbi:MAG TPA: hypothetical protein GX505_13390 [Clostridiales bacterium]|nr:hypothetical protein [Clostridiales bacterium]
MKHFHGKKKRASYFEGWYFKHTNENELLAFIPGISIDSSGSRKSFIQIISTEGSYQADYNYNEAYISDNSLYIRIGHSEFSKQGLNISINALSTIETGQQSITCHGKLYYTHLTPLRNDIMGPFRFVPFMECNHGVISVFHRVTGSIVLNGKEFLFHDNTGYIEKDWGTSFPEKYFWLQCNDFKADKTSIMLSIAEIPFLGTKFTGCICSVYLNGQEYRLATYKRVKVLKLSNTEIVIKQGSYLLEIFLQPSKEHTLIAPDRGNMSRKVKEAALGTASFRFQENNKTLFEETSTNVSYELVGYISE